VWIYDDFIIGYCWVGRPPNQPTTYTFRAEFLSHGYLISAKILPGYIRQDDTIWDGLSSVGNSLNPNQDSSGSARIIIVGKQLCIVELETLVGARPEEVCPPTLPAVTPGSNSPHPNLLPSGEKELFLIKIFPSLPDVRKD
jgi:hypothetical protein